MAMREQTFRGETSQKHRLGLALALLVMATALVPAATVGTASADEQMTDSAVTIKSRDYALNPDGAPFPDLEVTVSQTKDLLAQGIKITYKGGTLSAPPQGSVGGENFLQIAQCWGEDPDNPGHPDRRTCQYGGTNMYGARRDGFREADSVAPQDEFFSAAGQWASWSATPFVAWNAEQIVDEKKAPADKVLTNVTLDDKGQVVLKPEKEWANLTTNRYFSAATTNEISWAPFGPDGTGAIPFELQTAMQSPGLGCGNPVSSNGGAVSGSSCWLVIIPRGVADNGAVNIGAQTSGLWWDAWEHHLAIKLDFKPLGSRCELGAAERQLAGSELAAAAIASWQPVVCQGEGGSPFTLAQVPESDAVLNAAGTTPSALAFASRPLDIENLGWERDPLAYAPVALGGVSVSYVVDAAPHPAEAPEEYRIRRGLPLPQMKLTPRLLAKLLTASYRNAIPTRTEAEHLGENPLTIVWDPDFREINDEEWTFQTIIDMSVADALMPLGRSDLAVQVWEYILADPEAKAWLDGEPDPWGMTVNPWYSTNPDVNPTGVPLELPTDSFPKADPIERPDNTVDEPVNGTGAVNLVTWRPYTASFAEGAYKVLRGDGMMLGDWDRLARPPKFHKSQRQMPGNQHIIALSSTPSAQQYQTSTALLRNSAGEFVAPTATTLAAAAAAMEPDADQKQVVRFNPASSDAKNAKDAYPLTVPVYAALNPNQTDDAMRASYADLIEYGVTKGQTPGTDDGQLPPGYAPIPEAWRTQALAAAEAIRAGGWPEPVPSPSPSPSAIAVDPSPVPSSEPSPSSSSSPSPLPSSSPSAAPSQSAVQHRTQPPSNPPVGNQPAAQQPVVPSVAAQPQPPAQPAVPQPPASDPVADGEPAGALAGAATPDDPGVGPLSVVVPATGLVGVAAALGIPAISRFRRLP
ncbi:hypothetical protein LKO27_12285 [Tessaracoccus sp. OS52]|uniref:hypothetical protein n=1 Tax=Tessaracoccus sp. OS52 TaxID=2886691 RepID=UPI001D0FF2D2|nr:hypothetical protein [Tessaracoccus sp. OS52]MCC2594185.1 hypothetical protein [Tessaracoccus sp. OS52]